ncbi:MAG: hypothetical protein JNL79_05520 [Myxococcales bacterium]|nr:hypothetical protein [Myxococcales bacterium]
MTEALRAACVRAIHVLPVHGEGPTLRAGRAAMFALGQVGYHRVARVLSWVPFIWFVELGYLVVARNRVLFSRFLFRARR